jgi:hypothetical protein
VVVNIGAGCFGLLVGWVTYRTLRRREGNAGLSDIATVIGAVGGGAVTALFKTPELFGWYAIGLAIGFFLYLLVGFAIEGKEKTSGFMFD